MVHWVLQLEKTMSIIKGKIKWTEAIHFPICLSTDLKLMRSGSGH